MGSLLGRLEDSTYGEASTNVLDGTAREVDLTALKPANLAYPFVVSITCSEDCHIRQGPTGLTAATTSNAFPLFQKGERQIVVYAADSGFLSVISAGVDGTLYYMVQNNKKPHA